MKVKKIKVQKKDIPNKETEIEQPKEKKAFDSYPKVLPFEMRRFFFNPA